jgi:hypothetical protein
MKRTAILIIIISIGLISYQNCSVGGSEGGVSSLGSQGGPTDPTLIDPPIAQFATAAMTLSSTSANFRVTGVCDVGVFTNYIFRFSYKETGAANSKVFDVTGGCTSSSFSILLTYADLGLSSSKTGKLSLSIVANTPSRTIEGPATTTNISWQALPPACGDHTCNGTETCSTCPGDCGACAVSCGDHICNGTETCDSCAGDCGSCWKSPGVCRMTGGGGCGSFVEHGGGFTQSTCEATCRANGADCCEFHSTQGWCNTNHCGSGGFIDPNFGDTDWSARKF